VARVEFSYLSSDLGLLSVTPLKATPPRATIRELMDDIGAQLPALREVWWDATRIDAVDYDPDRRCLILWPVGLPPVEIDISPEEVAR
jgi:hypothetical protein